MNSYPVRYSGTEFFIVKKLNDILLLSCQQQAGQVFADKINRYLPINESYTLFKDATKDNSAALT
jgi:hypothetical protein